MTYVKQGSHFRLIVRAAPAVGAMALTAALYTATARAADYVWPVIEVTDGDTVKVDASPDLPPELSMLKVRLRGVDTPESRGPKCAEEKKKGREAKAFTKRQIDRAARIVVRDPAWGKYGGRVIADLMLDGKSLSDELIAAGHGRRYDGKRRKTWCPGSGQ